MGLFYGKCPIKIRHPSVLRHSFWWRRCIGFLKLQVSFRKRATNYRALLRKMTYEDKGSYGPSPLCNMLRHTGNFPQKRPIISGSFAKCDLQLKALNASSPLCSMLRHIGHFSQKSPGQMRFHIRIRHVTHMNENESCYTCE